MYLRCKVCGADEFNGPCKSCIHALPAFEELEKRMQLAENKASNLWGELRLLLRKCAARMDVNEDGTTKIPDEIVLYREEVENLIALINPDPNSLHGKNHVKYLTDDVNMLGLVCAALNVFNYERYMTNTTKAKLERMYKACENYIKYSEMNSNGRGYSKREQLPISVDELIQTIKNNDEEKIVAKR